MIRRAVAACGFSTGDRSFSVTLSAGVTATGPREGITPEGLLRRADQALYEAKRGGRNRIVARGHGEPAAEILLIEDDASEAEAIVRMCGILGCRADWARTGSAGVERAKLSRYALALVALELPDTAGIDAISRIRELSPATATALIAGAEPPSAHVLEATARFPVTLTRKPVTIDQLKSLLSEARRRS